MYAQKYDEEFSRHLPTFVQDIWQLLMTTGSQVKFDLVGVHTYIRTNQYCH